MAQLQSSSVTGSLIVSGALEVLGAFSGSIVNALTASYVNPLEQDVELSGSLTLAQQADSQGLTIKGFDDESDRQVSLYLDNFGKTVFTTNSISTAISTAAATWTSTSYIRINPGGSNYVSLADNSGKVMIGKPSGTAKLEVKGLGTNSSTIAFRVENANASSSLVVNDYGNVAIGGTPSTNTSRNLLITGPTGAGLNIETNNPRIDLNDIGVGGDNNPARIASYNGNLSLAADIDSTGTLPEVSLSVRGTEIGNFTETGLGIFNNAPSYALDVSGSGRFTGNLTVEGSFSELSARRFKENIEPLTGSLDKVTQLQGVSYTKIGAEKQEIGFIAEEVASTYPEFVEYDDNGEVIGIQYARLTSVLVESIKELDSMC